MLAPIIVFAFNRLDALKATVQSLLRNEEAINSDLFIYVDGPRANKENETEKVIAVQEYIKSITGFKSITYHFNYTNIGLGPSIIKGVSDIINLYGKAIIVEDDLIVSNNFLSFINQGLDKYETEHRVFSICGYSNKVTPPKDYSADAYFCTRSSSWGWATWKNRWNTVDWELNDWENYRQYAHKFNQWGGSDCWGMLEGWHEGRNKSWAIRFCFAQFLQDKLSLFPIISKVKNDGFDGTGTNCKKWSRFKFIFDNSNSKKFHWPDDLKIVKQLYKSAMRYNTLQIRLWSKIMYLIYR